MRSSAKLTSAAFSAPAVFCLLIGGAAAASRDPLVIPGIGPYAPSAARAAAYHPRHSPTPARFAHSPQIYAPQPYAQTVYSPYSPQRYSHGAHPAHRRSHARYWMQEPPPRPIRVASLAPRGFDGPAWEPPHPYDDEYRPAAYNGADAFPPPARPFLRPLPPARFGFW
jgi:hypothetical protein